MAFLQNSFNPETASPTTFQNSPPHENPAPTELKNLAKHWKSTHPYHRDRSETVVRFTLPESKTKGSLHKLKSKDKLKSSNSKPELEKLTSTRSRSLNKIGLNSKKSDSKKSCCNGLNDNNAFDSSKVTDEIANKEFEDDVNRKSKRKLSKEKRTRKSSGTVRKRSKSKSPKPRSRKLSLDADDDKDKQNYEPAIPTTSYASSLQDVSVKKSSKKLTKIKSALNNSQGQDEENNEAEIVGEKSKTSKGKSAVKGYVKLSKKSSTGKNVVDFKNAQRRVSRREYYGTLINERFKEWKREQDKRLYLKIARERELYDNTGFVAHDYVENGSNSVESLPTEQFIAANQYLKLGDPLITPSIRNLVSNTEYKKPIVVGPRREPLKTEKPRANWNSYSQPQAETRHTPRKLSFLAPAVKIKSETKVIKPKSIHNHLNQKKEQIKYVAPRPRVASASRSRSREKPGNKNTVTTVSKNAEASNTSKSNKNQVAGVKVNPTSYSKPILDRTGSKTLSFRGGLSKEILAIQGAKTANSNKSIASKIKSVFTKNSEPKLKI